MGRINIRSMTLDDMQIWEKFAHNISDNVVKKAYS